MLLDCCYGGAFGRGVSVRASGNAHVLDSFPSGKLPGGRGRAVITASSAVEYAFEKGELTDDQSRRPGRCDGRLQYKTRVPVAPRHYPVDDAPGSKA